MKWGWVKSSGEGINLEQEKIFLLWILEAKRWRVADIEDYSCTGRKLSKFKQYSLCFLSEGVKVRAKSQR